MPKQFYTYFTSNINPICSNLLPFPCVLKKSERELPESLTGGGERRSLASYGTLTTVNKSAKSNLGTGQCVHSWICMLRRQLCCIGRRFRRPIVTFLPEHDYVTFEFLLSQFRLSVVCNVWCTLLRGLKLSAIFLHRCIRWPSSDPTQNFTEIVPGERLHRER